MWHTLVRIQKISIGRFTRFVSSNIVAERSESMATAGIIVIGDEILKGFTKDTNSHFLCKNLHDMSIKVEKISVIADSIQQIASEVAFFSKEYTYVFTTGGIGPTHDDVTYAGVCAAFDDQITVNQEVATLVEKFINHLQSTNAVHSTEVQEKIKTGMKMAELPSQCTLHYSDGSTDKRLKYPLVSVKNVYIFPGIPSLLEKGFTYLRGLFNQSNNLPITFHVKDMYFKLDEWSITDKLNLAVTKFKDSVTFGSYPDIVNPYYKVKITVESSDAAAVDQACSYLQLLFPKDSVVNLKKSCVSDSAQHVYNLLQDESLSLEFKKTLKSSLDVIEKCLEQFTQDQICISFNGGKDCTVLLHLFVAVLQKKIGTNNVHQILTLYVSDVNSFSEIEQFVDESIDRYKLKLLRYKGDIKEALTALKSDNENIKGILMGTRSSDPYSSDIKPFYKTDSNWPEFMRVNPILDWSYDDIWTFLHSMYLPYCILYDQGYTSIGRIDNTVPNPLLKVIRNDGTVTYSPAHLLQDGSAERLGRTKSLPKLDLS